MRGAVVIRLGFVYLGCKLCTEWLQLYSWTFTIKCRNCSCRIVVWVCVQFDRKKITVIFSTIWVTSWELPWCHHLYRDLPPQKKFSWFREWLVEMFCRPSNVLWTEETSRLTVRGTWETSYCVIIWEQLNVGAKSTQPGRYSSSLYCRQQTANK